jgi:alpha-ketoglutarate-dependent taurine dioxygenase
VKVEPLDTTLGAVVTGVRLATLDDAAWASIEDAFNEHAVLVFPGQGLSREEQAGFARRFGELDSLNDERGYVPIANTTRDGGVRDPADPVMAILRGNQGWHTDSSYMPVSAKASMLSAHVVPSHGGATEWADMRAAYDALDLELRTRVETLSAYHSIVYSQRRAGEPVVDGAYGYDVAEEPLRPLVKMHPATGRRALFIGRHAHDIRGLTADDSTALLDELLAFACQPPRVYTHHWTVGDLVVWDNRCVLHRAQPWDWDEPRVMVHTCVAGDPVTEAALTVA